MRLATTATLVYPFEELSKEAQAVAIQEKQKAAQEFVNLDFAVDYIREIGEAIGIVDMKVYYSGFYSQGDGMCFVGRYWYKKGWRKALEQVCTDPDLLEIAEALQEEQKNNIYSLYANVTGPNGYYTHYNSVSIDVYRNDLWVENDHLEYLLREFMKWGYAYLQKEYEYQTSEEYAKEVLEDGNNEFTADGQIY